MILPWRFGSPSVFHILIPNSFIAVEQSLREEPVRDDKSGQRFPADQFLPPGLKAFLDFFSEICRYVGRL